jgi:hypothetical protein
MFKDPIIVLGPARSFTTVIATMLGQHPQLYGFPETHLLVVPDMRSWWQTFGFGPLSHGLFRLIAEVAFGGQTAATIALAKAWASRQIMSSSDTVFRQLSSCVAPRPVVDKSPLLGDNTYALHHIETKFPDARFLHVTRHPLGQGISMLEMFERIYDSLGPLAPADLSRLPDSPLAAFDGMLDFTPQGVILDPQLYWLRVHNNIIDFLEKVSHGRQLRVRGEDVLKDPERQLERIASWLGVRVDSVAIDSMMRPERSSFSRFGPVNAIFGGDPKFLAAPELRRGRGQPPGNVVESLSGPVPWRPDGIGFSDDVCTLAAQFGYC